MPTKMNRNSFVGCVVDLSWSRVGGCPDDGSRQPFRIIQRPKKVEVVEKFDQVGISVLILVLITVLFGLLYIDLKIRSVRKI